MPLALTLAILAAIIWGLDYSLAEEIFKKKISPITLIALEMFLGSIIVSIIGWGSHFKTDINLLINDRYALLLFIAILITFNLGNLLIFYSIKVGEDATVVAIIEMCYPLFTVFFTWLLFNKSHLNTSVAVGCLFILTGVAIISYFNR